MTVLRYYSMFSLCCWWTDLLNHAEKIFKKLDGMVDIVYI